MSDRAARLSDATHSHASRHPRTRVLTATGLVVTTLSVLLAQKESLGALPPVVTAVLWLIIAGLVTRGLDGAPRFGVANLITSVRAAATALLAGLVPVAAALDATLLWGIALLAFVALLLDGVDGAIARVRDESSAFGARYDMEIDALLALVMALLLWRSGEAGVWILALGSLRYLFLAAARLRPALAAPLYPSLRRKCVCVMQIGALAVALAPVVAPPVSTVLLTLALVALVGSFARDVHWLLAPVPARA